MFLRSFHRRNEANNGTRAKEFHFARNLLAWKYFLSFPFHFHCEWNIELKFPFQFVGNLLSERKLNFHHFAKDSATVGEMSLAWGKMYVSVSEFPHQIFQNFLKLSWIQSLIIKLFITSKIKNHHSYLSMVFFNRLQSGIFLKENAFFIDRYHHLIIVLNEIQFTLQFTHLQQKFLNCILITNFLCCSLSSKN